jgi:hypothetical protein
MRSLFAFCVVLILSACSAPSVSKEAGQVLIVDRHGTPIQNGVLMPDDENPPAAPRVYDKWELKDRASDAQGFFHIDLEDCLWSSDGCYHFRIHRAGYDDFTMSVSKELFPPVLKIVMVEKTADTPLSAAPAH